MSLITVLDGTPLYTTTQEALNWALSVGLTGYHTHQYQGVTGFMGGVDHSQAISSSAAPISNPVKSKIWYTLDKAKKAQQLFQPTQRPVEPIEPVRRRVPQVERTPVVSRVAVPVQRATPVRTTTPIVRVSSGSSGGGSGGY